MCLLISFNQNDGEGFIVSEVIDMFGLTKAETCLLFSMQYYLINADYKVERNAKKWFKKQEWRDEWKKNIEAMLKGIQNEEEIDYSTLFDPYDSSRFEPFTKSVMDKADSPITKYLILLELVTFNPYYPFKPEHKDKYEGLKLNKDENEYRLMILAQYLDIPTCYVNKFIKSYENATEGIKGNGWRFSLLGALIFTILAVLAAPLIAPYFAAAGLHGAAAYAAGLAALGGGAIAAGGFGMAGGMAVIVGGGAILGGTVGNGIGAILASSPDFALTQAAKLEVIFKEVILLNQKDVRIGQEILKKQRASIMELENQLSVMKLKAENRKDEIESMKKAIKYLREALERNEKAMVSNA